MTQMLKIKDVASLVDIIKGLLLNGYEVKIKSINQEWPRENCFDYYEITAQKETEYILQDKEEV